jgi:hypothetical protein
MEPHSGVVWRHQLITEEEVFGCIVLKNSPFLDHLLKNQVIFFHNQIIFSIREMDSTEFIPNLLEY